MLICYNMLGLRHDRVAWPLSVRKAAGGDDDT
jgi:hypothetical protein